mmetsp:Transcript_125/g.131  ORF Transcript_125/g.131 Transcript_125/m.131 type:complete len:139 (-) Transcript_125:47-463(-)|eukprot:jgi/Bigna1/90378/estExt_fgenesh1_pg.C_680085
MSSSLRLVLLTIFSIASITHAASYITTNSGLQFQDLIEGTGQTPRAGDNVRVHYTGWLNSFESSKKFDSSRDRGQPFSFQAGVGRVIKGWDEAILGMKVGTRRRLVIPSNLAYGPSGINGVIPGGATLYFDVELLGIN